MIGNGRNGQGLMAGSFLGGLLVGGLVGTGITLLTAPRSGEETRRQIQEEVVKAQMGVEQTLVEVEQTLAEVGQKISGVGQALAQAQSRALEVTDEVGEQAAELQALGSTAAREEQEQIESSVEEVKRAARRHRPFHSSVEKARQAARRLSRAR